MIIKGTKINDRYAIIRTLGEGGMANVYLAYDTILDRNVAVKVLRGDLANDDKFVRRFQREALSASSLNHPNIVEMYDVGEDDGQYYIVMEYVEGKTLKQLLKKRGSLTITEVIDIMSQITDGMAHAHDSYIIHRDIKPQNIMILENGLIKITDFGIAMAMNSTQLTQTNSVMGSVHYLPPEQANGKGSTLRSDIYSMGILMYELLTGGVPYKGDNAVEIALKHLKEPLPSIRKKLPELPQSIENIILRSTAKNPQNRYKDAREMHQDIITAMDESRANERKYNYVYSESDIEETKMLDNAVKEVKESEKMRKEDIIRLDREESKKQNKLLIILASIFTGLVVLAAAVVFLLPYISKDETKKIPDVSNLSAVDATNKLVEEGFEPTCRDNDNQKIDYKYEASDEIKEGYAIKTTPGSGTLAKEGREVCIVLSSGDASFEMEDYSGRDVNEVIGILSERCKEYKCTVRTEKQTVREEENKKENTVLSTSPAVGEAVKSGDSIILYVPDIEIVYPNFADGTYNVDKVREFAEKYKLNLTINEEENGVLEPGTIISQSRPAGNPVQEGVAFTITIAKAPKIIGGPDGDPEDPEAPDEPEGGETNE